MSRWWVCICEVWVEIGFFFFFWGEAYSICVFCFGVILVCDMLKIICWCERAGYLYRYLVITVAGLTCSSQSWNIYCSCVAFGYLSNNVTVSQHHSELTNAVSHTLYYTTFVETFFCSLGESRVDKERYLVISFTGVWSCWSSLRPLPLWPSIIVTSWLPDHCVHIGHIRPIDPTQREREREKKISISYFTQ